MPQLPVDIILRVAPACDERLLTLLRHKGSPWVEDIQRRLAGEMPGSRDYFFMACRGDDAHDWYTVAATDPRLGLVGHVYTRSEHRRRGLAARLMQSVMDQFRAAGGQVTQLFTDRPEAVALYERFGFRQVFQTQVLHNRDWSVRYGIDGDAPLEAWLGSAACTLRDLTAAVLPRYCLLFNLEYETLLKDRAQGMGLGVEAEWVVLHALGRLARGQAICSVLDNGPMMVGMASMVACRFAHQSHVAMIDYYVHP